MKEIEFVITFPDPHSNVIAYENKARRTHGVIIDVILAAKKYIIISSPYMKDLETSNKNINKALKTALKKGITLIVISTETGFTEANIKQYKGSKVYLYTPDEKRKDGIKFSHAKFCLSDGAQVYLGSANFTFAGLNRNLEMGVYSNTIMAKQVEKFWRSLIDKKFFIKSKL